MGDDNVLGRWMSDLENQRIRVTVQVTAIVLAEDGRDRLTREVACVKDDREVAADGVAAVLFPRVTIRIELMRAR